MWRRIGLLALVLCLGSSLAWADTSTSTSTLSISPSATSGTTITAADENSRNNDTSTDANTHVHALSNTTNFGDGTAGNKFLCADAANTTDACIRWNDTDKKWQVDQISAGTFNTIIVQTGTAAFAARAVLIGTGDPGRIEASTMILASTVPSTFGDLAARAFNSGNLSITSGTATIITLDSERWDTDTIHNASSNTGRLTATTAGRYQITGHIELAHVVAPDPLGYIRLEIRLNGSTILASHDSFPNTWTETTTRISISTHYNLACCSVTNLEPSSLI